MKCDGTLEIRVLSLVRDMEKKLQQLGSASWLDLDSMTRELAGYCESCLNVCDEFLARRDFAVL